MIESKGHKITPIDGDLAVSRNAEIGRDVDIQGKARVAGSLKVEGFLDAPHIKGAAKGLFNSVEELTREYPNPRPGWFAIVLDAANKEKGILYKAENRGWVATTDEAKPYEFIQDSINVFASKGELEDVRSEGVALDGVTVESLESEVNVVLSNIKGNFLNEVIMPSATTEYAGVMSAEDKRNLDYSTVRKIAWNNDTDPSNMNDFVTAGVYDIKGERTRANDNLPILNTGGGHSFNARLTVLDSSIPGDGKNDDKCITQVLSFSNRLGQGEVYIRTGKGSSLDNIIWENWSTLQRNVNVNQVNSLDGLIDNGIYSGVLNTTGETFVLVVINNYAVVGNSLPKSISQFKYSVSPTGVVSFGKRVKVGDNAFPADWEILNYEEINSMISKAIDNVIEYTNDAIKGAVLSVKKEIFEGVDPNTIDSIKDIATWIEAHGGDVIAIYKAIEANTTKITAEITRAKDEEQKLNTAITEEATRAKNKENELATAINTGLNDLGREITEANGNIKGMAMQYNTLGVNVYADKAEIYGRSIDGKIRTVDFPTATTEMAGVMSAADKDKLNNSYKSIDVSPNEIDVELDIEDNTGNTYHIPLPAATTEMSGVMSSEDKKALNDSVKKIDAEISRAKEAEQTLNDAMTENVEAILNVAEQVGNLVQVDDYIKSSVLGYDRQMPLRKADKVTIRNTTLDGKKEHSFDIHAATTEEAGVMSAEDKKEQVKMTPLLNGDTIVGQAREIHSRNGKTVTDSFLTRTTAGSGTIGDGVASLKSVGGNIVKNLVDGIDITNWESFSNLAMVNGIFRISSDTNKTNQIMRSVPKISGHMYFASCDILCVETSEIFLSMSSGYNPQFLTNANVWTHASVRNSFSDNYLDENNSFMVRAVNSKELLIANPLLIDLTETFGAGNEPTKTECNKLFGVMDALPQGLTIANPTEFKSIGYNQADPNKVLVGKGVDNGAIVNKEGSNIAVIPCLPCKVGVGENNGYCIHGEFGDEINVYLTPLNPMEVDGELFMHKLIKDATTDTYVPQIKGYMLVEVPTTANLCAHFLWSEDKCKRDSYEPYHESKIELPTIPEMSEWGLAGIQSSGTLACDEIDFERGVYIKRIVDVDLGFVKFGRKGGNDNKVFWITSGDISFNEAIKSLVICEEYTYVNAETMYYNANSYDKVIYIGKSGYFSNKNTCICIRDSRFTDATALQEHLKGIKAYYYGAEEEYPLPKVDNNYISSDYGVEQFDSVVPCNANNLYYMRSLAGETRNFLDRLMAGLGTSDVTVVADRILAVVNPAVEPANVEPETPIEE